VADWVALLNFLSRWTLFAAVTYKAYQTRDKGWALLSIAFFIDALNIESYILTPLGIKIPDCVYTLVSKIPNFYIGLLLPWGATHLKNGKTTFRQVIYLGTIVVVSYVWLFLIAVNAFGNNFAVNSSVPSLVLGGAMIYAGYVLWSNVVSARFWDRLFPVGLILVGALNLTYPVGRPIEWYSRIAFFLAALGRLSSAVGALFFVFYPIKEPEYKMEMKTKLMPGAYIFGSMNEVIKKLGRDVVSSCVAVVRMDPEKATSVFHNDSVVFWLTKVKDGIIREEHPRIIAINPQKLGILQDLISKELGKGYKRVYVDALEYLKNEMDFNTAVKFLLAVKDMTISHEGSIVLVVNLDAFNEKERKLLIKEFGKEGL
jgi:transcriptional regulator of NAD metabolism